MQDLKDFLREVETSGYLQIIEEVHADDTKDNYLVVRNNRNGAKYKIMTEAIAQHNWQNLKRVLDGGEPQVLEHMTRIVGYFSKTKNWNKSKLGELQDRQQGSYEVK